MIGLVSAFLQIALPYQVRVIDAPIAVLLVNSKAGASFRGLAGAPDMKFFDRGTGKLLSPSEALPLMPEALRNTNIIPVGMLQQYYKVPNIPFAMQPEISAAHEDIKTGVIYPQHEEELIRYLTDREYRFHVRGLNWNLPVVWLGKENRMEILPEPAFLVQAIGGRLPQVGDQRTRTFRAIYDVAATDGDAVVGTVEFGERRNPHALYWDIGTDRCILLHPPQATSSRAYAVDKGTVGGMCAIQGREFATVWLARQPVLLKENAIVRDVRGDVQVGHAYKALNASWDRAALWKGTPESYIDLHKLLPATMKTSKAINIAEDGTIYGTGRDTKNHTVGIEWKPNPLYKPKKD